VQLSKIPSLVQGENKQPEKMGPYFSLSSSSKSALESSKKGVDFLREIYNELF
jgi:hypothetical protein